MTPMYLFAYGTLNPDAAPPEIKSAVAKLRPRGRAHVRGRLIDFGDYPGVRLDPNGPRVFGTLYELPEDPSLLRALDEYEEYTSGGHANLFNRVKRFVELDDVSKVTAWLYELAVTSTPKANTTHAR